MDCRSAAVVFQRDPTGLLTPPGEPSCVLARGIETSRLTVPHYCHCFIPSTTGRDRVVCRPGSPWVTSPPMRARVRGSQMPEDRTVSGETNVYTSYFFGWLCSFRLKAACSLSCNMHFYLYIVCNVFYTPTAMNNLWALKK